MKLSAVQDLKREIEHVKQQLESLRTAATVITPTLDGLPRSKATTSQVERFATRIVDVEQKLSVLAAECADASIELVNEIYNRVGDGAECAVLILRYVSCKTFAEIAASLSCSKSAVFRLHLRGKQEFERTEIDDKN